MKFFSSKSSKWQYVLMCVLFMLSVFAGGGCGGGSSNSLGGDPADTTPDEGEGNELLSYEYGDEVTVSLQFNGDNELTFEYQPYLDEAEESAAIAAQVTTAANPGRFVFLRGTGYLAETSGLTRQLTILGINLVFEVKNDSGSLRATITINTSNQTYESEFVENGQPKTDAKFDGFKKNDETVNLNPGDGTNDDQDDGDGDDNVDPDPTPDPDSDPDPDPTPNPDPDPDPTPDPDPDPTPDPDPDPTPDPDPDPDPTPTPGPTKYTVTFSANGGSGSMASLTVNSGTAVTLTANTFTWASHRFDGWATSATGSVVYQNQASVTVTANLTLYAHWTALHTVTLTGGANATTSGGQTTQSGLAGAMTAVTYTADNGYHFAEFADITNGGITATRTSDTSVTVSGTPTGNVSITIPDAVEIAVTDISLNKDTLTLTAGGSTETLTATITPSNAKDKTVTWSSNNASVASVANGVVTPVAAGTATITATAQGGKTATCSVTVNVPTYAITITTPTNGQVTASATSVEANTEITLTISPDTGYLLGELRVLAGTSPVETTPVTESTTGCTYKFTMPAAAVSVSATFRAGYAYLEYNSHNDKWSIQKAMTFTTVAAGSGAITWGEAQADRVYVATGEVTIDQKVTIAGTVHLILADGAKLTLTQGVVLGGDNALDIYAQSTNKDKMGRLIAQNGDTDNDVTVIGKVENMDELVGGTLAIYGGAIEVPNTQMAYSLCADTLEIFGGQLSVESSNYQNIYVKTFTMYDGQLTAQTESGVLMIGDEGTFTMSGGTLSATSDSNAIRLHSEATFVMNGGQLTAICDDHGEGLSLGGDVTFTMNGGKLTAAGDNAPGITLTSGVFTMKSGDLTAHGGEGSSGIRIDGVGNLANGGSLTIEGGILQAFGGDGNYGGIGIEIPGDVTITGETTVVKAIGGHSREITGGAGLSVSGKLEITGGDLTFTGGDADSEAGGDGIYVASTLTMSSGTLKAAGGLGATKGGAGVWSDGTIAFSGGKLIATGGDGLVDAYNPGAGGYGIYTVDIAITGGEVEATGGNGGDCLDDGNGGNGGYAIAYEDSYTRDTTVATVMTTAGTGGAGSGGRSAGTTPEQPDIKIED